MFRSSLTSPTLNLRVPSVRAEKSTHTATWGQSEFIVRRPGALINPEKQLHIQRKRKQLLKFDRYPRYKGTCTNVLMAPFIRTEFFTLTRDKITPWNMATRKSLSALTRNEQMQSLVSRYLHCFNGHVNILRLNVLCLL